MSYSPDSPPHGPSQEQVKAHLRHRTNELIVLGTSASSVQKIADAGMDAQGRFFTSGVMATDASGRALSTE
jgi:hypothetical protein